MTLTEISCLLWLLLAILLWRAGNFFRPVLWLPCLAGWMAALLGVSLSGQNLAGLIGLGLGWLAGKLCRMGTPWGVKPGELALVIRPFDRFTAGQIRCRGRILPARGLDSLRKAGEIVRISGQDGVF